MGSTAALALRMCRSLASANFLVCSRLAGLELRRHKIVCTVLAKSVDEMMLCGIDVRLDGTGVSVLLNGWRVVVFVLGRQRKDDETTLRKSSLISKVR